MTDLSRLTKAEILKLLEEKDQKVQELEAEKEAREQQIELDMSFGSDMTPERKEQLEKQRRKDYIKRMTHGRWTSEEKYNEYIAKEQGRIVPHGK